MFEPELIDEGAEFVLRNGDRIQVFVSDNDGLGIGGFSLKVVSISVGSRLLVVPESNNAIRVTTFRAQDASQAAIREAHSARIIETGS